jgi:hypothetical protein
VAGTGTVMGAMGRILHPTRVPVPPPRKRPVTTATVTQWWLLLWPLGHGCHTTQVQRLSAEGQAASPARISTWCKHRPGLLWPQSGGDEGTTYGPFVHRYSKK